MPAAAPPGPADSRSCDVVHSAATALSVGDAPMLGVALALRVGVSVGLGGGDGEDVGDAEVVIDAVGDAVGLLELPLQPAIATTEPNAQIWTSRRTRRA